MQKDEAQPMIQEEENNLKRALELNDSYHQMEVEKWKELCNSLRKRLDVAEKALEDLRTGIYHTSRVTGICEEALSKIQGVK